MWKYYITFHIVVPFSAVPVLSLSAALYSAKTPESALYSVCFDAVSPVKWEKGDNDTEQKHNMQKDITRLNIEPGFSSNTDTLSYHIRNILFVNVR